MDQSDGRPVLLVLGDSLTFHGPRRPMALDDERLWPNIVARQLDVHVEVFAGFGWTARHGWYALNHEPRLWAVLPKVDAVILALGQFDTLPAPLPNVIWRLLPQIRDDRRRERTRRLHHQAVHHLTRVFAHLPDGGPVGLRPDRTVEYLEACRKRVVRGRRYIPVMTMTPGVHRSDLYCNVHRGRLPADRAIRRWAADSQVALLDLPPIIADHMSSDDCCADGMHWGWEGHKDVGDAIAKLLEGRILPIASHRRRAVTKATTIEPAGV